MFHAINFIKQSIKLPHKNKKSSKVGSEPFFSLVLQDKVISIILQSCSTAAHEETCNKKLKREMPGLTANYKLFAIVNLNDLLITSITLYLNVNVLVF
jgi:hypothetical protein